jgi:hypothetical protein
MGAETDSSEYFCWLQLDISFLTGAPLHYCLHALSVVNSGSNEGNEVVGK